jgi:glucose-6-phosphate-specific signal transduction histidine kinase
VENQTPDSPNKEAVLDHLEEIYQRTRFLSRSTGAIETGLTFKEELLELMSGFSGPTVAVIALNVERIDWNLIATTSKITLYRVLQELLVNMKKHSGANRVQITFETSKHQLVVHYEDNGIGMPTGVSPKNGLVNVENRILTLGGSISFETHQPTGCALKFILPK